MHCMHWLVYMVFTPCRTRSNSIAKMMYIHLISYAFWQNLYRLWTVTMLESNALLAYTASFIHTSPTHAIARCLILISWMMTDVAIGTIVTISLQRE